MVDNYPVQNVVVLVDTELKNDEVIVGADVLGSFEVGELQDSILVRKAVIRQDSEIELGVNLSSIREKLSHLIEQLQIELSGRYEKANRKLELAKNIQNIDEYGVKVGIFLDVQEELSELNDEFPEIYPSNKLMVDALLEQTRQIISESKEKRERFAERLCADARSESDLVSSADDISIISRGVE